MPRLKAIVSLLLLLCGSTVFADQIVLKNGDRLTGTIEKSDAKSLTMKTEFAGEISVQFAAIQEIKSDQPLHVGLKDGQTVVGPVTTTDGKFEVATKAGGTVEAPKENIVVIRSDTEQNAWENLQHPGLLQGWDGGINFGFGLTRGNSQAKNLAANLKAARKGLRDKLSLYAGSVYSTNDLPTATPHITANTNQGGARYDRDITSHQFGFVNTDFFTDALQDLNLRSVVGGGWGWHAIAAENTTLDIFAGANYTHEDYTQLAPLPHLIHSFAAGQIGDELSHKLGKATVLSQKAYIFPDLSNAGEYRATLDLGTVTQVNRWLGWHNSFSGVYVTNPPQGKKTNDIILTTGLTISFKR